MNDTAASNPLFLERNWLSVRELAGLAGIIERNVRDACKRCHEGGKWRGVSVEVRKRDGKAYEVHAPSLPPDLYAKWLAAQPKPPAPVQAVADLPALAEKPVLRLPEPDWVEDAKWKQALIEPALAHPPRSRARGREIAGIARREGIKARTLSDWIKRFENDGQAGLVRQHRHDAPRVLITRKWGAECPLPDEAKADIAAQLKTYIKSLWRSGNPGCKDTARLATSHLQALCREAGWGGATLEQCKITRHLVERFRGHSLAHTYRKDAKASFDHHRPRIQRDHSQLLPMEQVVGDVHPIDVLVRRDDGSTATPRFIAWYDVATHRLCGNVVLLPADKGVTQADVWSSFADMVGQWGLPTHLYLDNGPEYCGRPRRYGEGVPSAIMTGLNALTGLALAMLEFNDAIKAEFVAEFVDLHADPSAEAPDRATKRRRNGFTRAMPNNAPGKTGIEGVFASLEKVMVHCPGYIGGNRMAKRTPKLGKETPPCPDMDTFMAIFTQFLDYWNGKEQQGNLAGKSPHQALADAQQDGWQAVAVDRMALIYAMSEKLKVTVTRGTVTVGQQRYRSDKLIPLSRQKIEVRYAKWAPEYLVFWPDPREPMVLLEREVSYHVFDQEGAREAARRQGVLRDHVRSLEAESVELDMVKEIALHNAARGPAPETVFGPTLSLGPHVDALTETAKRLGPPAEQGIVTLQPGESVDRETGEVARRMSERARAQRLARRDREKVLPTAMPIRKKQGAGL